MPPGSDQPLISVVTVCFNAAPVIDACLDSVARQTYPRIEHVVIDGGSTDGTLDRLQARRDRLAVLVSEPDGGIYDEMNKGIARSGGEFVLFLNADDLFASNSSVADAVAAIARDPGADVYYGSILVRGSFGTIRHDPVPPERAAEDMVLGCLPHQATFARRSVFARTGLFDLRWRRHADYDWWMKVLSDPAITLRRIDALVASFALGGASSDLEKGQPEVYAIQNAAPLYRSPEWDRKRLEMFQDAYLRERIELARLREQPTGTAPPPVVSWRHQMASRLPRPVVRALRAVRHRLARTG